MALKTERKSRFVEKYIRKICLIVMLTIIVCLSVFEFQTTIKGSEVLETAEEVTTIQDGFYKKYKKKIFYKNGETYKGFLKYKKKTYYFDKKGYMVTGFKKIGKHYYFFQKDGAMKIGFHKRKYKKKKILNYYNAKGRLCIGKFKVKKATYKSEKKSGRIYYVYNNVKNICQKPQLPTGCEITAWTMMANYAGVKISKIKAANIMPRSSNPNYGFMGSPYKTKGGGLVVYPLGLKGMTKNI